MFSSWTLLICTGHHFQRKAIQCSLNEIKPTHPHHSGELRVKLISTLAMKPLTLT